MRNDYNPDRVLRVACPTCDAKAGERCKSKAGKVRNRHDYHATRKGIIYPEFASKRGGVPRVALTKEEWVDVIRVVGMEAGAQSGSGDETYWSTLADKLKILSKQV